MNGIQELDKTGKIEYKSEYKDDLYRYSEYFKDYVDELLNKKFVQINVDAKGKKLFSLTKKGNDFLEEYKIIENFVENFGL